MNIVNSSVNSLLFGFGFLFATTLDAGSITISSINIIVIEERQYGQHYQGRFERTTVTMHTFVCNMDMNEEISSILDHLFFVTRRNR